MGSAMRDAEPETLADVRADLPYCLRVAARLLGRCRDTVYAHAREFQRANPSEPVVLPKAYPNSPVQVWGREILRQCGRAEIDKAARTPEQSETERQRAKRVADGMARLLKSTGGKPKNPAPRRKKSS